MVNNESIQEQYYARTAEHYDAMHLNSDESDSEHVFALHYLSSIIKYLGIKSILDVGAGTGRTIEYLNEHHPDVKVIGIEPVEALRVKGYEKGISKDILIAGDGNAMTFKDNEFDLVCEFAVLHHVPKPELMVSEMLRVSKKAIFISDSNNFGQGSFIGRTMKQIINSLGFWKTYNYIRTKGKNYQITEGDGLFYSYSVFNNYNQIKNSCKEVHLLNTKGNGINVYKTATHVALLGVKN